ncbi:MAG: menaquinone biosynthesis protein [Desulfobulbaceae bacterium]|nr:menaquinone biosynthesis protein [Desulfobulbaceae bacterium]
MKARIGMVNFINTAPLYCIWKKRVKRDDWLVTEAPPTTLNRMLCKNELDLGFVSSHEYAVHPHLYNILADITISATGAVGSVFLFSKLKPQDLSDKLIRLSGQSQTSVALVKIILDEFYKVTPLYVDENEGQPKGLEECAILAIGDEALRLKQQGQYPYCLDLSEEWQKHTELPFVFAVWAVRKEFCEKNAPLVREIHRELLTCIKQGKKELRAICSLVAPRIPMEVDSCYEYLCSIEYDLSPEKKKGLELFFDFLVKRGEAPPEALPVKMCG